MKRTLSFMVMALALLLTQCRKPEVKFPSPVAPEGTTVSMTVTAGPGSKTDITTAGAITWSSGDKLYVGYNGAYVGYLTLTSGQNTPTGWFSGNVTLPDGTTGEKTFHFFYLGRDNGVAPSLNATTVDVSFATQEIYADANNKLANASKYHVGYGTAQGTVAGSEVTGINVTLVSKVALARFSFKKAADDEPYEGALTLSGDHIYNSMTVGFGGTFDHGATAGNINLGAVSEGISERYVMLVPAGAGSATLNFGGEYEGVMELAQGIEANKYYGQGGPIEVVLTKAPVPVTGVTLNKTELSLEVGAYETLTATVTPETADNKNVTWSSSNESVATVSDGLVTAVAAGSATITVTTEDGKKTATCAVTATPVFTVNKANGTTVTFAPGNLYYNGADNSHKMNENLPSGWNFYGHQWDCYPSGTTLVTASNEISLFTWGYGDWSTVYDTKTYQTGTGVTMADWGTAPGLPSAGEGKKWRTLTDDEWKNLLGIDDAASPRDNAESLCEWVTLDNGVKGLVILPDGSTVTASSVTTTSLVASSGAVFLPAAGLRNGTGVSYSMYGYYWSSHPGGPEYACFLGISTYPETNYYERWRGMAVRLVRSAS